MGDRAIRGGSEMNDDVRELLDASGPEVRELALALRERIREVVPDAAETVMRGYRSLSYDFGGGMRSQFAAIVLHGAYVNLQFPRGTDLPDPAGLLEGTGRAMRHVKVRSAETIRRPEVEDLIASAAALARA